MLLLRFKGKVGHELTPTVEQGRPKTHLVIGFNAKKLCLPLPSLLRLDSQRNPLLHTTKDRPRVLLEKVGSAMITWMKTPLL
jgi:hypothetical protein